MWWIYLWKEEFQSLCRSNIWIAAIKPVVLLPGLSNLLWTSILAEEIINDTQIAGYGINWCQNEHIKSTPSHPAKLSYVDGKQVAKCTEEVIFPPVQLTDNRYISWFVKND